MLYVDIIHNLSNPNSSVEILEEAINIEFENIQRATNRQEILYSLHLLTTLVFYNPAAPNYLKLYCYYTSSLCQYLQ